MSSLPWVRAASVGRLVLRRRSPARSSWLRSLPVLRLVLPLLAPDERTLFLERAGTLASFEWVASEGQWEWAVEKVDSLLVHGAPGHKYLTDEGVDDALIELSFGDNPLG